MVQEVCSCCKSRFFVDEEDVQDLIRHGHIVCHDCQDYIYFCPICKRIVLLNYTVLNEVNCCPECAEKHKMYKSTFFSIWYRLRFLTFLKDKFTCKYCGRSPLKDERVELQCDHILPRAKGGEDVLDNLVTACLECNQGKLDVMLEKEQERQLFKRKVQNGLKRINNKTKAVGCVKMEDIKKAQRSLEHS